MTWPRALRAAVVAVVMVAVVAFVGANFVLVDVRLFGLAFQTRLAWVVVVPAALAFGAGVLYELTRRGADARAAPPSSPRPRPTRRA
jgi:hypothetical protein